MKHLSLIKATKAYQRLSNREEELVLNPPILKLIKEAIPMVEKGVNNFSISTKKESYQIALNIVIELSEMWNAEGNFYKFPITSAHQKYYYKGFLLIDSCDPIPLPVHVVKDESAFYPLNSFDSLGSAIFAINQGDLDVSFKNAINSIPTNEDYFKGLLGSPFLHEQMDLKPFQTDSSVIKGPIQKPTITKINIDNLQDICQLHLDSIEAGNPEGDIKEYIYKVAMTSFFGHDVWNYINSKTK